MGKFKKKTLEFGSFGRVIHTYIQNRTLLCHFVHGMVLKQLRKRALSSQFMIPLLNGNPQFNFLNLLLENTHTNTYYDINMMLLFKSLSCFSQQESRSEMQFCLDNVLSDILTFAQDFCNFISSMGIWEEINECYH